MKLTIGIQPVTLLSARHSSAATLLARNGLRRIAAARPDVVQQLKLPKMNLGRPVSTQLKAIADLRWRMFVNGLRSRRGKTEFASRMVVTSVFALGGLGGFLVAIVLSRTSGFPRQARVSRAHPVAHFFLLAILPGHGHGVHQ